MAQLFTNNAISELFAPITAGATSMDIVPGDESLFPTIAGGSGDTFRLTIEFGSNREIVLVNSTSVNTFTMTRAQEGTTAQSWSASATVALRVTAQQMQDLFPVDLTTQATGTLPESLGGTGNATYTIGDILIATAVQMLGTVALGASNTLLGSTGGAVPAYTADPIITTLNALTALKTGSTPASTGELRMSNTDSITHRNAADASDLIAVERSASDQMYVGDASETVAMRNETALGSENGAGTAIIDLLKLDLNDLFKILQTPVLLNDLALSTRDNADTVTIPLIKLDTNDDIIVGDGLNRDTGMGRTAPEARHHFGGSVAFPVRTVTANATFGDDWFIIADGDASSNNITLDLPSASLSTGRIYATKRLNLGATFTTTVEPAGSETIDGATNVTLTTTNQVRIIMSDGTEWKQLVGT